MLAAVVRSGIVEATHQGAVAVVDPAGRLLARSGDIDRPFLGRSSFKPFQAQAALEAGSDLTGAHLAITCSSHPATPAHVAFVEDVLERAGLTERHLQTPAAFPSSVAAMQFVGPTDDARSIWHNCSGKHAGMLVAAASAGFDLVSYRDPAHPLQERIGSLLADVLGHEPGRPAVDGCGAPVYETNVVGLALGFARLASEARFETVRQSMQRHPRLIGADDWVDVNAMLWVNGVAKGGAEGVVGIGLPAGFGIAIKAWDGSQRGVYAATVDVFRALGFIDARTAEAARVSILGGGVPVGTVEGRVELEWL